MVSLHHFWCLITSIVLFVFWIYPCWATTIVAIRTSDTFVMASDSEGTFKGDDKPVASRPVSKIYHKVGVVYAVGGLAKDAKRGFDPAEAVAVSLEDSEPLLSAVTKLEAMVARSLKEELLKLQIEEPALFRDSIEGDNAGTTILFARFEKDQPVAIGIRFFGTAEPDGNLVVRTTRLTCPGDCPNGTYTFFIGHHKTIDKYVSEHGKHFAMPPEEAVRFMVQLEIDAKTPGVGPPIDTVRLDKNGVTWVSDRGQSKK